MSRVLVTGATGFVGARVVDALLDKQHEVHAVARKTGAERPGLTWHAADLLAPAAAESVVEESQARCLMHLAWYAVPGRFWTAPENERWIDASLRLVRAFGEAGGRRAVMAGTCAEYRWGGAVLSERETALEPATLYGACKRATYLAAESVAADLGMSLAWGRIFFLYGPGEPLGRLVSGVITGLLSGASVPTTDGHQRRDFMHVDDVANAFAALVDADISGAINIATGEAVRVRDVVELIERAVGVHERVRYGALPTRAGEPEVIVADARRMHDELGFRPMIALGPGLVDAVAWWRDASPTAPSSGDTDSDSNL